MRRGFLSSSSAFNTWGLGIGTEADLIIEDSRSQSWSVQIDRIFQRKFWLSVSPLFLIVLEPTSHNFLGTLILFKALRILDFALSALS